MRRFIWLGAAMALMAAACERTPADPLAQARAACGAGETEPGARVSACSTLIDSATLTDAERTIALANRGGAYQARGEVTAALRDFQAALALDGENMLAVLGRASILIESGQLDAAQPLVERLRASGRYAANAHYLEGEIMLRRSDAVGAIIAFNHAVEEDGHYARALWGRARAKHRLGDQAGALADYDAAIAADSDLAAAYAGRCWVRLEQEEGDLSRARADADVAARSDPGNVEGQLCRGVLQLRAGEWDAAKTSFEAALEVAPGNATALFGRGVARRRGGDNAGREDMNQARDFDRHVGERFDRMGVRTF